MKSNINCEHCGKCFTPKNNKQKFCCLDCKRKHAYDTKTFEHVCSECNISFKSKSTHLKSKNSFCSKECEDKFKYKKYNETRTCEICKNEFQCRKSIKQRFCSLICQIQWQKENPRTGDKHPCFKKDLQRIFMCEICKTEFIPKKIRKNARFCSDECRQKWYADDFSQREEWKESKIIWATSEMKKHNKPESSAQVIVNNILEKMNVNFENERIFGRFAVDNFLLDYNLAIEVMGTFWHCDTRIFDTIKYKNQKTRIRMDKIKNTVITKNYNVPILYIWEYDLQNNLSTCIELIKLFISINGKLNNFDSCNYSLFTNTLLENKDKTIQYMYWDIKDINNAILPDRKEKMSHIQQDKWTTFKCENCGTEKKELTSHYSKSKNHFCSMKCYREFINSK